MQLALLGQKMALPWQKAAVKLQSKFDALDQDEDDVEHEWPRVSALMHKPHAAHPPLPWPKAAKRSSGQRVK